jgi:hypothetical protein
MCTNDGEVRIFFLSASVFLKVRSCNRGFRAVL